MCIVAAADDPGFSRRSDIWAMAKAMRVWRDGVLVQRMCIAKTTEMYFSEEEARQPCGQQMFVMPAFWLWHKSGNLDAQICNNHAAIALRGKYYLSEQIQKVLRESEIKEGK